jgi:hypothetical protein
MEDTDFSRCFSEAMRTGRLPKRDYGDQLEVLVRTGIRQGMSDDEIVDLLKDFEEGESAIRNLIAKHRPKK